MGKPIAVEGCVLTCNSGKGKFTIDTPPSTKVMIDGKGAYSGTISVSVTGFMGGGVAGGSGSGPIIGTATKVMIENAPAVLLNDTSTPITISGVSDKDPSKGATTTITLEITEAGQSKVMGT